MERQGPYILAMDIRMKFGGDFEEINRLLEQRMDSIPDFLYFLILEILQSRSCSCPLPGKQLSK